MNKVEPARGRGRRRSFDRDQVLDTAMRVFWEKGYEGASLAELTTAMRINPPSLYAAFGNKETLFGEALERYRKGPTAFMREALKQPTAGAVVQRLLFGAADFLTEPGQPNGCLSVQTALSCGVEALAVHNQLVRLRRLTLSALRRRLQRAQSEGDLPANSNPVALARYVTALYQGMAVQAAGGVNRQALREVVRLAMQAWPV